MSGKEVHRSLDHAKSDVTLEEYLRKNSREDSGSESLVHLSRRLRNPPNPTPPDTVAGKANAHSNEGEWRETFETHLNASELRKGLSNSLAPYIAIALFTCAVSGSAFFFLLRNYAASDGPRGPRVAAGQTVSEPSYGYADPDLTAGSTINDAETAEGPTRDEPSVLIANSASPAARGSPSYAAVARNQDISAEGTLGRPAKAANEKLPASQTSEASISKPSIPEPLSVSAGAAPTEASQSPLQKSETRMAALTPPADAVPVKSVIPSMGNVEDLKPATTERTTSGTVVPDKHLPPLAPDQEGKMLNRASELLKQNDIAGARLIYQYLADRGSPSGALALAESYDPNKWARYRITGMVPDASLAKAWYRRAAALGSQEAAAILRDDKR